MLSYNIQSLVLEDSSDRSSYTVGVGDSIGGYEIHSIFTVEDKAGNFTGYSLNTESGERIALISARVVIMAKYIIKEE